MKCTTFLALCTGPLLTAVAVSAAENGDVAALISTCTENTFMCCWTGNDNGMPTTFDVCRVLDYPGEGEVLEMPRDDEGPVYCHGFTWENGEENDVPTLYGHLMLMAEEGGFSGSVAGSPECGCIEDMPVVDDAACSKIRKGEIEDCVRGSLRVEYKRGAGDGDHLDTNLVGECDNTAVPNFEYRSCDYNTYMCCWTENDDQGMQDNTDVCRVGNVLYPDEEEGEVHCHGLVWPEDATDRYIHTLAQYVQNFDHRDKRGYYGSLSDAPMCGCIEDMPEVTRADCSRPNPDREGRFKPCPGNDLRRQFEDMFPGVGVPNLVEDCSQEPYIPVADSPDSSEESSDSEDGGEEAPMSMPMDTPSQTPSDSYDETSDPNPNSSPEIDESLESSAPQGEGGRAYQHLGCFKDRRKDRVLEHKLTDKGLTTDKCYDYCFGIGASLMATQWSKECWCATNADVDYGRHGEAECDLACAGDTSESCGGTTVFDLYLIGWDNTEEQPDEVIPEGDGSSCSTYDEDEQMAGLIDGACASNTFMCCWTGKDGSGGMVGNSDVCRVLDYPTGGDVLEMPGDSEGPVYCHGFAWPDGADVSTYILPLYHYVKNFGRTEEGGFYGSLEGTPECGCVEDMPVVDDAACSTHSRDGIVPFEDGLRRGYKRVGEPNGPMEINLVGECDNTDVPDYDFRTCELNTYMCCWTENDGQGMQDNTDVCRVGDSEYPGEKEGDVHCHGFVWPEDATDRYIHTLAQFVQNFDHRDKRGYYGSLPGAPMCGCIEQMPEVSRADCSYPNPEREGKFKACTKNDLRTRFFEVYPDAAVYNLVGECDNE